MTARFAAALLIATALLRADTLDSIRKEPDLLRRSERALEFASTETRALRDLIQGAGTRADLLAHLDELDASVKLSLQALRDTGRKPGRLSRQYKRGELLLRGLLRQMDDVVLALGVEDRPAAERVRDTLTNTHEEFLLAIMTGK